MTDYDTAVREAIQEANCRRGADVRAAERVEAEIADMASRRQATPDAWTDDDNATLAKLTRKAELLRTWHKVDEAGEPVPLPPEPKPGREDSRYDDPFPIGTFVGSAKERWEAIQRGERHDKPAINKTPDIVLTRAVGSWALAAHGRQVTPDDARACATYGTAIHSPTFEVKLEPTGPMLGRERFNRSLGTNIGSAGGVTVSEGSGFMARLETAMLNASGMLNVAETIVTTTGEDLPWPTCDDSANEGRLVPENGALTTATDPSFNATIFKRWKLTSDIIKASTEIVRDSSIGMANVIADLIGQRLGRALNRQCTTGNGVGTANGLVTSATLGKTAALTTAFTADELIQLMHSVEVDYRNAADGCGWMFHDNVASYLRQLKDANGQYLWQQSVQAGLPDRLFGWPIQINNHMDSAFTTGKKLVLFGAFKKYKVRLVNSIRLKRLTELYAANDQEGFLGFLEFDGALLDAGTHPVRYLALA